jgi:hypothetical protein
MLLLSSGRAMFLFFMGEVACLCLSMHALRIVTLSFPLAWEWGGWAQAFGVLCRGFACRSIYTMHDFNLTHRPISTSSAVAHVVD